MNFTEQQLNRYIKITTILILFTVLATGILYFYYYKKPSIGKLSIVEQQIAELQKRIKAKPGEINLRINLARAYLKNKDFDEAIKELKEAVKIDKENATSHYILGLAYKTKGEKYYDLAEKQFNKVIELVKDSQFAKINTNLKSSYYYKGEINFEQKKFKNALADFNESADIGTTDSDTLRYIGRSYLELKEYKKAKIFFDKAIKFVPNYAEVYYDLGRLYAIQNDKEKAKKNFKLALKYKPTLREAKKALDNL